jgi:hypothetical protein
MSNKIPNITVGGGILTTSAAAFNSTLPVVMVSISIVFVKIFFKVDKLYSKLQAKIVQGMEMKSF